MSDELVPGIRIVKSRDTASQADSLLQSFEVQDTRGSQHHGVTRIAFVFAAIDTQVWAPRLFDSLKRLAECSSDHLLRPLEWGRTSDGGLYVLQENWPLAETLGPLNDDERWDLLRQAAEALQNLHESGLHHGHLSLSNLLVAPGPRLKIQGAAWGSLHDWSDGIHAEADLGKLFPKSPGSANGKPNYTATACTDVYALGVSFATLFKTIRFRSRQQDALFQSLTAPTRPRDGGDLLRKIGEASQVPRLVAAVRAVRDAFAPQNADLDEPLPILRRKMAKIVIGCAIVLLAAVIALTWFAAFQASDLTAANRAIDSLGKERDQAKQRADMEAAAANEARKELQAAKPGPPPLEGNNVPPLNAAQIRKLAGPIWKTAADDPDKWFAAMKAEFQNDVGLPKEVKQQLLDWTKQFDDGPANGKYKVKLAFGRIGEVLKIYVDDQLVSDGPVVLDAEREFAWATDQSIKVEIWSPHDWWNPVRVLGNHYLSATRVYVGPAVLWNLSKDGRVNQGGAGAGNMRLEVIDPPGP